MDVGCQREIRELHLLLHLFPRGGGVGLPWGVLVRGTPVRGATVSPAMPPPPTVQGAPTPWAPKAGIQSIPLPPPLATETREEYAE
jgi:RNA-binding signal transduction-associated protein 1 with KH domain